ncbi:hypothetical protein D3Z62_31775 [Lachnospiraceae bacterium]|jgi:hypothetical protein|nr:hypothetical protein [Lachnospiraceae bacterium]
MEVEGVDTCMLKEYLEKNYGYNEPIFINEIRLDGLNDNALRQYFKRMLRSGDLARFDTGIYYLPKASRLLKKSYLDPMKVIMRKYVQSTTETYGYFAGATFANQIGLTTQMPATLEIVTSKESTKGRTVTVGSQAVRLKRPATTITSENAGLLQFLDAVSQAEKYSELSDSDTGILLKNYAKQQNYSKELLSGVLLGITGPTAKKLIEWGIIYEFTS